MRAPYVPLRVRARPSPPPHGIWGGRAKDAGGTDLSDSGSPEEVLGCEAPTRKDFQLNHPNPRPLFIPFNHPNPRPGGII